MKAAGRKCISIFCLSQRQQSQPCRAHPWSDAVERLGEVPDVDTESISLINTMASKLQLPTAILATTVSSAPCSIFFGDDTISVLYHSPLGQGFGLEPSGMGQSLV